MTPLNNVILSYIISLQSSISYTAYKVNVKVHSSCGHEGIVICPNMADDSEVVCFYLSKHTYIKLWRIENYSASH